MNKDSMNKDSLRKPRISGWVAGPAIAIAWFLFWPVGIFLTYKRARVDKKAAVIISIILIILGSILLIGALRFLGGGLNGDDLANMNALAIMGSILVFIGIYTIKSAKRYLKYITLVVDQECTSIDNIAHSISTTYDVAKRDLERLIRDGYFNGSYIDESTREIILPTNNIKVNNVVINYSLDNNDPQAVTCKGCGANNKVSAGTVGECEFCGSPISI
jgi:hypothetical protein